MAKHQTSGGAKAKAGATRAGAHAAHAAMTATSGTDELSRLRAENAQLRKRLASSGASEPANLEGDVRYDKAFHVEPVGAKSIARGLVPATITHCCDASEAKRLYFARNGIIDTHHYELTITEVEQEDWSGEENVYATAEPQDAVRPEPYLDEEGHERKDAAVSDEDREAAQRDLKKKE